MWKASLLLTTPRRVPPLTTLAPYELVSLASNGLAPHPAMVRGEAFRHCERTLLTGLGLVCILDDTNRYFCICMSIHNTPFEILCFLVHFIVSGIARSLGLDKTFSDLMRR